jgi:hypothetical protein
MKDLFSAIDELHDETKLRLVIELVKNMSQESKDQIVREIALNNSTGEAKITVTSNNEVVGINFSRPLAWLAIPKAHALQLGMSLMEHAGATVEQIKRPKPDERN